VQHRIYSVSELTGNIKSLLEETFPFVWLCGEISNFRKPISGHCYFTLKDEYAQINAVMFRGQLRQLKFDPQDGMNVTGMGRISVYEPRGTYQIILEYVEPSGIGALQVAFEKLKMRLAEEGFFEERHKKTLPFLPQKLSLITSVTGAVIHDMLTIIDRRFADIAIQIIPVKVQGDGAVDEIVAAIEALNAYSDSDVAILARGGGSLEDLQAFNSEAVAKAIFNSKIPIVSAIGHETDYTISDFVADLRAPTPSAAAELVVPEKKELKRRLLELSRRFTLNMFNNIDKLQVKLNELSSRLVDPRRQIEDFRLRLDDLTTALHKVLTFRIQREWERLGFWKDRLHANIPINVLGIVKYKLDQLYYNLLKTYSIIFNLKKNYLHELTAKLEALSPIAILERGYSITRTIPDSIVVKDPERVSLEQDVEVTVSKGRLFCRVKGKSTHGQKNLRTIDESA